VSLGLALGSAEAAVKAALDGLDRSAFPARLWRRDPASWGDDPARQRVAQSRLGWLTVPARMNAEAHALGAFGEEIARRGFTRALLLGMGGSSLAPEVLRLTFGVRPGALDLAVLDNTSPAAVRAASADYDPARTLVLVSSKSGGTIEVASFEKHFEAAARAASGDAAGGSFIAITDPGTSLEALAGERGYRRAFLNPPDIGGRYSALSYFGLVPAALIGADLEALLDGALEEAHTLEGARAAADCPGIALGATLGALARAGRDKVTLALDPRLAALASWIEQLLAESTGKDGAGLIPIADEPLGAPEVYGIDRVFVAVSAGTPDAGAAAALDRLERAGHAVLRWSRAELDELGAEFMRWEIATATAGAVLGVDPFDEPNVAEAKETTKVTLERFVAERRFPPSPPGEPGDLARLLGDAKPGDYVAILAWMHRTPERHARLARLRAAIRDRSRLATTLGYGPRYLHSTGQLHKGGPNRGLFLHLTADEGGDVPIPGQPYGFAALREAQALGDLEVLRRRGRRVVHLHLGHDVEGGLERLIASLAAAARA
jgi:glucose-6-phosphate isomerase